MILRVILSAENSHKNSEHVTKRNCGECKKRHSEGFATKGDFSKEVSLKGGSRQRNIIGSKFLSDLN